MFQLFLPYLVGTALGIAAPVPQVAPGAAPAAIAAQAVRVPEPQVPTGLFTTATEVRPIVDATSASWVAVRLYEGQDLLYFTQLLSWRCGLWDIHYGLNGAAPTERFDMEPCHDDSLTPNAMTDVEHFLPYVTLPPDSIQSVTVEVTYDNGARQSVTFERAQVQIN